MAKKRDRKREAVGAAAGAAGGQAAYQGMGYGPKHATLRFYGYGRGRQVRRGPSRNKRDKTLKAHLKEHGGRTASFERTYPKSLPEWKTHRVLGYTHRGKTGMVTGAVVTGSGALLGLNLARKPNKKKISKRKPMSDAELSRRKKRQALYSTTTATLGLSALGTKGLGAVASRASRYPKMVEIAPKLDRTATTLTTGAAGIGGFGGYNFAATQREEARKKRLAQGKKVSKGGTMSNVSAFGVDHGTGEISKSGYGAGVGYGLHALQNHYKATGVPAARNLAKLPKNKNAKKLEDYMPMSSGKRIKIKQNRVDRYNNQFK